MTLPNVDLTVLDGGLGGGVIDLSRVFVVIGPSSSGTSLTPTLVASPAAAQSGFGRGPLVALAALLTQVAGRPVIAIKSAITGGGTGSVGSVTHAGAGASTGTAALVSGSSPNDAYDVVVTITKAGTAGTDICQASVSLDGGISTISGYSIPTSTRLITIPNTNVKITFSAASLVAGDTYSFSTVAPYSGVSDLEDALTALNASTLRGSIVVDAGVREGTDVTTLQADMDAEEAVHRYMRLVTSARPPSVGGFNTPVVQSGAGPVVTVSGTSDADYNFVIEITTGGTRGTAVFKWSSNGGVTYTTAVTTAATAVLGSTGITAAFATGTYVLAETYTWESVEAGETEAEWMAELIEHFAAVDADRVSVGGGFMRLYDVTMKAYLYRPLAWDFAARLLSTRSGVSAAQVDLGALPYVYSVQHDERVTPGLNDARFVTTRTYDDPVNFPGYYIGLPKLMAPPGSDFSEMQYGRVMDAGCAATYVYFTRQLASSVRITRATGYILGKDALALESGNDAALNTAIVSTGDATSAETIVSRTDNILATKTLNVSVGIVPLGYLNQINVNMAFVNPVTAAA